MLLCLNVIVCVVCVNVWLNDVEDVVGDVMMCC